MKRFREFLAEGIETDYSELFGGYLIPFSEKMWQRITDEQFHTMYGIHVTDIEGVETVFNRVVGRKKSLPVMEDVEDSWLQAIASGEGVVTDGGVILICQGLVIAKFGEDIASRRDNQGRRWVDITMIADKNKAQEFKDKMQELQDEIFGIVILSQDGNPEKQLAYKTEVPDGYDGPEDYWRSNDIWTFENIFDMGNGMEKRAAFAMYMDGIEKELKNPEWKEMLSSLFEFGGQRKDDSGKYSGRERWNEMFMINTRVIKAYVIADSRGVNIPLEKVDRIDFPGLNELRRNVRKIEYYDTREKPLPLSKLRDEVEKITQLNGRIRLNAGGRFNFPTEY